jgi:hypothetical protein
MKLALIIIMGYHCYEVQLRPSTDEITGDYQLNFD